MAYSSRICMLSYMLFFGLLYLISPSQAVSLTATLVSYGYLDASCNTTPVPVSCVATPAGVAATTL